ncbi:hypothetical protein N836_28250 [Leptolyngbya sp. Heron Island J]|uniref:hypothetical protein n=1 Tax=Leptolyngbya sp. Heron Island J TaxID=1385935 RepID=UPI0003B99B6D|nr:hypothetical protein [Leptolyngbya sp. Heron Island J]ESA32049.1 hypothetical protein N836_28250 [Leptolyngbya sp. Heron Island J]
MTHQHLTQNIADIRVTECEGSFLITVSDSFAAAIVLERVIRYQVRCWIGLHQQQTYGAPFIYAAYPLQMWMVEQSEQVA